MATYRLADARNRDWEDIAVTDCGPGRQCLYLADTGDNEEVRDDIAVYRVPEPAHLERGGRLEEPADRFPIRLPDGPRDIEALFALPGEQLFFLSKGRSDPVTLYRYPPPLRPEVVTLEEIQVLSSGPLPIPSQVTGADASPDGALVVVRTYQTLSFYRWEEGQLKPVPGGSVSLRTLQEPQGEAVGLAADGRVALTSEARPMGWGAAMHILSCPPSTGLQGGG